MTAALIKWYEYEGQAELWNSFWHALSHHLPGPGLTPDRDGIGNRWKDGAYALTWACGGDVALNPDLFEPLVVPAMAQPGQTQPGFYRSLIVGRVGTDLADAGSLCLGLNYPTSFSGHLAFANWWFDRGYPRPQNWNLTGGHENSVRALVKAEVDLVAIDAQGWHLLMRAHPDWQQQVVILGETAPQPAPPLCRPKGAPDLELWRAGFAKARAAGALGQDLGVLDLIPVTAATYAPLAHTIAQQIKAGQTFADVTSAS